MVVMVLAHLVKVIGAVMVEQILEILMTLAVVAEEQVK